MATLGELRKKLAKLKKEGASTQTKGRVQYQINQILKKDKGKTIKTKSGFVKTKSGFARQKDTGKKITPRKKTDHVTLTAIPSGNKRNVKAGFGKVINTHQDMSEYSTAGLLVAAKNGDSSAKKELVKRGVTL